VPEFNAPINTIGINIDPALKVAVIIRKSDCSNDPRNTWKYIPVTAEAVNIARNINMKVNASIGKLQTISRSIVLFLLNCTLNVLAAIAQTLENRPRKSP